MPTYAAGDPALEQNGPILLVMIGVDDTRAKGLAAQGQPIPTPVRARMLIDTGASGTSVRVGLLAPLGLPVIGQITAGTAGAAVLCNVHFAKILFPPTWIPGVGWAGHITEVPLQGQNTIDGLLGRDVLSKGIFNYSGALNGWSFSI